MTIDQLIQLGVLLCGIAAIMVPFHMDNRRRQSEANSLLRDLSLTFKFHERRDTDLFKKHSRRLKKLMKYVSAEKPADKP